MSHGNEHSCRAKEGVSIVGHLTVLERLAPWCVVCWQVWYVCIGSGAVTCGTYSTQIIQHIVKILNLYFGITQCHHSHPHTLRTSQHLTPPTNMPKQAHFDNQQPLLTPTTLLFSVAHYCSGDKYGL